MGGGNNFFTYRYVYFEGEGGILRNKYITADTKSENIKEYFLGFMVRYKIIRMKFMDHIPPSNIDKDDLLI